MLDFREDPHFLISEVEWQYCFIISFAKVCTLNNTKQLGDMEYSIPHGFFPLEWGKRCFNPPVTFAAFA